MKRHLRALTTTWDRPLPMIKLIAVNNRSERTLTLTNQETSADDRTLLPGKTLTLGQKNYGVDIPSGDKSIVIQDSELKVYWEIRERDGYVYRVFGSSMESIADSLGRTIKPDEITLHLDETSIHLEVSKMPELKIPKLRYVRNSLPQYLRLENRETSADNVNFMEPGEWTPVPGQYGEGIDIPECTSASYWDSRRIRIARDGTDVEINIYRIGYDIFQSFGPDYPAIHQPIPGGHSQGDGASKALLILGKTELSMIDTPADIQSGAWNRWPSPTHGQFVVHASVDLMVDYEAAGSQVTPVHTYATRIEVRDHNNNAVPDLKVSLTATPSLSATINNHKLVIPKAGQAGLQLSAADGNYTITHPAGTLSAPVLHLVLHGKTEEIVDVHPADKVTARMDAIKTDNDWRKQVDGNGRPLLKADQEISPGVSRAFRDLVTTTLLPSAADAESSAGARAASATAGVQARGLAGMRVAKAPLRRLSFEHLPNGYTFGFKLDHNKRLVALSPPAAQSEYQSLIAREPRPRMKAAKEEGFWPWVTDAFSSWWNDLTSFVCSVVDGVMTFVAEVAGEILNLIVETVSQVFQAIALVLEKAFGLTMEVIVNWLGTLFDWDSIKATHQVIRGGCDNVSGVLKSAIDRTADHLAQLFASGLSVDAGAVVKEAAGELSKQTIAAPMRDQHNSGTSSPAVQWAGRTFLDKSGSQDSSIFDRPGVGTTISNELSRIGAVIKDAMSQLQQKIDQMSLVDFASFGVETARKLIGELAQAFGNVLKSAAETVISMIEPLFGMELDVPILSALFRANIDSTKTKTTVLDLLCFVVSIPATLLSKLFFGRAPFQVQAQPSPHSRMLERKASNSLDHVFGLNITTTVCQLLSATVAAFLEAARLARSPDTARKIFACKLAIDMIGFSTSMSAAAIVKLNKENPTPREQLDLDITALQAAMRIKDLFRLATFKQPWSAGANGVLETIIGLVGFAYAIKIVDLQRSESGIAKAEMVPKTVQMLCMTAAQVSSVAREAFLVKAPPPPPTPGEVAVAYTRVALAFAVPAMGMWRIHLNRTEVLPS